MSCTEYPSLATRSTSPSRSASGMSLMSACAEMVASTPARLQVLHLLPSLRFIANRQ